MFALINVTALDTSSITSAFNTLFDTAYQVVDSVAGGIAIVAVAVAFISMLISTDAASTRQAKKGLIVIAIAIIGVKLAPTLVTWIQTIGTNAANNVGATNLDDLLM